MLDTRFKKVVLGLIVTALCGAAQIASAHTGIKDKVFMAGQGNTGLSLSSTNAVAQSSTAYDAFTITHGCASNAIAEGTPGVVRKNIIAMAAVFPDFAAGASKVYRYKTGSVNGTTIGVDGTVLTGTAVTGTYPENSLDGDIGTSTTASALGLGLVSSNLFGNTVFPILNAAGGTRGYYVYNSLKSIALQEDVISTTGLSPFKFTVPVFNPTSCAANLIVRVAVSNWCSKGLASKTAADRKDVWIGTDTGSVLYSMMGPNHEVMPNSRTTMGLDPVAPTSEQGNGKSFWPAFTVHRDPATIPASCAETYDVVVQPTGSDIDSMLKIPGGFY